MSAPIHRTAPARDGRSPSLAVDRLPDDAALDRLAIEWRALFSRAPGATAFQSPDWLLPWWHSFRPGDLAVLAVRIDGRLAGLAPFYVETREEGSRLLPLGVSLSDYGDVLVEPGAEASVLPALATAIPRLCPEASRLDLGDLPASAAALVLPVPEGWRREENPHEVCPVLDLSAGFGSVPASRRRKLRMARHRAERAGGAVLAPVAAGEAGAFLDTLVALHAARWKAKGGEGVLADPRAVAFHRAALPRLIAEELADCRLLTIGGRIAGAYYGLTRGAHACAYLSGFDPSFTREAPGTLLIGDAVVRACAAGCAAFHFLRGGEPYKYDWGAADRWTRRLSLVRDGANG